MNGWEFAAKVIEALAWPVTALVLVALLRTEVLKLVPKLSKFEAGPLKAEFAAETKSVLAEAQEIRPTGIESAQAGQPTATDTQGLSPHDDLKPGNLLSMMESPAASILDAWRSVEAALLELIADRAIYVPPRHTQNVGIWINAIAKEGILPNETLAVLHELRDLRNKAAHAGFDPTPQSAVDYWAAAKRVERSLKSYVRRPAPAGE